MNNRTRVSDSGSHARRVARTQSRTLRQSHARAPRVATLRRVFSSTNEACPHECCSQSGWWTGGRLLVNLGDLGLGYMRFSKDVGTGEWRREDLRTVLETDATVVFMSEAAAGSLRKFPWWHGRVGDGITMTVDIRIGQPRTPTGSCKGKGSARLFFYSYANGLLGTDEAYAGGGSSATPPADYPTSKLLRDEASRAVCSWCGFGKPDFESNDIFKSKSPSPVSVR
jgi:hypothetical protein